MSGFVAVVSLGGDTTRPSLETQRLATHYRDFRDSEPVGDEVGKDSTATAVAFGCEVTADERGWTVVQGSAYGPRPHPLTEGALSALDGQFAAVSYDAGARSVLAATDAFANAPVYWAQSGDLVYLSTSALVLARHLRPSASADAVRNFLVSGVQFGHQTHWQGVSRLDPGCALHLRDGTVAERPHWQPAVDPDVAAMDLRTAARHLVEVLIEAMRQRLSADPTWLDLTGGYDSRMIALMAERAGVRFTGNTRESGIQPDVAMARDIAARKGWPWRELRVPWDWPERLPQQLDHALAAADGRLEVLQLSRVAWGHQQLAQHIPRLLSGGGGEHLQDKLWVSEFIHAGRGSRRAADLERFVDIIAFRPLDLHLLADGSRARTREDYLERLTPIAQRYADDSPYRQIDACWAVKSSGHFGAYRAADDLELCAQLPFYWKSSFSASFSVDPGHRRSHRLMREMMQLLDPEIARLRTTRGGPAVPMTPATFHRFLPYYGQLARKAVNKVSYLSSGWTPFPFPVAPPWPERESNLAAVAHLRETGVLDPADLRIRDLLSDEGMRRILSPAPEMNTRVLGRILTVEMALAATGTDL